MKRVVPGARFAIGEGWRNAVANHIAGVVLTVLSALVVAGICVADTLDVARLAADQAQWIAAGGNVLVVTNDDGVPARECEQLNHAAGVKAAVGVVRQIQRADLGNAPDANLPVVGVTAGLTTFLDAPIGLDTAVVSTRTAEDYGLSTGDWADLKLVGFNEQGLANGPELSAAAAQDRQALSGVQRLTVTDLTILGEQYSSGIAWFIPASGTVDACLVWAQSGAKDTLRQGLPAILPGSGDKPTVVADRLVTGQFTRDYHSEYLGRAWRWTPLLAGAGLGVVWILLRWTRRSDDGLYQSLGVPRPVRALLHLTEWLVYALSGAVLGLTVALVSVEMIAPTAPAILPHILRSALLCLAASVLTAAVAGLLPARNPLDALKDR